MRAILVANPKGGAGKTTVATNLSGYLATAGERVFLWDLDRQKSSLDWLSLRPSALPPIHRLDERNQGEGDYTQEDAWVILDTPAGLHGKNLTHAIKLAEKIIVPLQPSLFDMAATRDFLDRLLEEKVVRRHRAFVGIVGMRVDPRTRAAVTLEKFLSQYDLPVLTYIRDTVTYTNAAFQGLSVFDLPRYQSEREREQWQPVVEWVHAD